MVAASQPPAMYLRACSTREGARPHISVQVDSPTPICLAEPLRRRSACQAAYVRVVNGRHHRVVRWG